MKLYSIILSLFAIIYTSEPDSEYINKNWPINDQKQKVIDSSNTNKFDCPNGIGCECIKDSDCINSNCEKHFKVGNVCTIQAGDTFPHFTSKDQFDEPVDIYNFAGHCTKLCEPDSLNT